MIEINGYDVRVPYGNADEFAIIFDGDVPEDGTMVRVTVKKSTDPDEEPIWVKEIAVQDGQVVIPLTAEDTTLTPDTYFWDMQFIDPPSTPMPPAAYEVRRVVGHEQPSGS